MKKASKRAASKYDRYLTWLNQSQFDIKAAKHSFDVGFYEWTCYQAIQSVEKALKAIVVHAGYRPPKTHKLGVLVSMSNRAHDAFKDVRFNFRKIESYTFISRYPFVIPNQDATPHELVTKQDAETCITIAEDINTKIVGFLAHRKPHNQPALETKDYYFSQEEIEARLSAITKQIIDCPDISVQRILVYGSFAREHTRPRTSTLDVLVIGETDLTFVDRIQQVREVTRGGEPIIEALVYTPSEFSMMIDEEGEGYLESALDEAVEIYRSDRALDEKS